MKNITLCSFLLLCLGSMPLLALKGKDDDTAENPKPVAAAASTTPAVAKAEPRKVLPRPELFVLDASALKVLQSTEPGHTEEKGDLLENAARAVELIIERAVPLPTEVMALFSNVGVLSMNALRANNLPLLPCPEKLESLIIHYSTFQTIQNITHYTNLHTLEIISMGFSVTDQHPNQTNHLAVLTQLCNLRTLKCDDVLMLDHSTHVDKELLIRILDSNPEIEYFECAGGVDTDVVQALANLPLRKLQLWDSEIDDDQFALLPFDTLEELTLDDPHTLTNLDLETLRDSALRVLHLRCQENLGDTQVIRSMQNLEELDLRYCRITDTQAKPLLQLASRLRQLKLDSHGPRLSAEMCQRLKAAFGDKVSL